MIHIGVIVAKVTYINRISVYSCGTHTMDGRRPSVIMSECGGEPSFWGGIGFIDSLLRKLIARAPKKIRTGQKVKITIETID